MYRLTTLASVLLLLSASLAPSVLAQGKGKGKGHNAPAYGMVLEMVNDVNSDDLPNFGDSVKFNVSTTATTPFVSLNCYQGSNWVYAAGGYPADSVFNLSANSWPGGAADCTATLYTTTDGSRTTTLATLSVHVSE